MSEETNALVELAWKIQDSLQAASAGDYSKRLEVSINESLAENPLVTIVPAINLLLDDLRVKEHRRQRAERRLEDMVAELQEKLKTIEHQSAAIRELSTPVIQVWDQVLVLPLIGAVDTLRSQQILTELLQAVADREAVVAIIDVTGVPVMDTAVAGHLLTTIQSVRLLGAEVIVTGIHVANAQTLVTLGLPLEDLSAEATLQAGLARAFRITGATVSRRK